MVIVKAQVTFGETMKAVEAQTNLSTDLHSDINRKLPTGRKTYFFGFTAVAWDERSNHTSTYVRRCLMSAAAHSASNPSRENDGAGFRVLEKCDRSLFLSATKRPFPAAAADKTSLSLCCLFLEEDQRSGYSIFGIRWGILDGRLSLRLNGFVSTLDYTGRQNAENEPVSLMGSRVRPLWYRQDMRLVRETNPTRKHALFFFFHADEKRLDQYLSLAPQKTEKVGWTRQSGSGREEGKQPRILQEVI